MPAELVKLTAPDFILKVLGVMYQKPDFLRKVAPVLKPEYFESVVDGNFAEIFIEFAKKYPSDRLTPTVIGEELGRLKLEKKIVEADVPLYLNRFVDIKTPVLEPEFIMDKVFEFAETKAMELALADAIDLLKKGKLDEIVQEIARARAVRTAESEIEAHILSHEVDAFLKELKMEAKMGTSGGIETGIEQLDMNLFWHGVALEEMFIDCGPPGRGKSVSLLNKAVSANLQGYDVLYYTLEVGEGICRLRYYSCLTGVPITTLRRDTEIFETRWKKLKERYPKMGKFILRDLPARVLKPSGIESDIRRYRDMGVDVRGVVVDYADIMASDKKFKADDKRLEVGNIYEELRRIGKEYKVFVYTASQGNRGSLNKKEIDIDSLAEDFSKAFTADYVCGLCQTKAETMERTAAGTGTGTLRIFIAKNRNGNKGVNIPLMTDYTCARLSLYDWRRFDSAVYGI